MADLDALAPNYRRSRERWPDAPMLAFGYDALKVCFGGNAHGLIEHVKSFVECVCITIINEFQASMPANRPSMTELLVVALDCLGLRNTKGVTKLDKVLSGFNKIADAISEMRNEAGPVAHGKDGFLDAIAADHARSFLHAGDAILGLLLNALEGKQPDLAGTREPYESFPHFNEQIDRAVAVEARIEEDEDRSILIFSVATGPHDEAIELRIEPSRLLYGVDRTAYVEILRTIELLVEEEEEAGEQSEVETFEPGIAETTVPAIESGGPTPELKTRYEGALSSLREGVEAFLQAEKINLSAVENGAQIVDSLLATADHNLVLDWTQRETMQAKLKVACKRVLVRFGCELTRADDVAERFVSWLRGQAPDGTATPQTTDLERRESA